MVDQPQTSMFLSDLVQKPDGSFFTKAGDEYDGIILSPNKAGQVVSLRDALPSQGLASLNSNSDADDAAQSQSAAAAQQANNGIISNNQNLAQQMINQTAAMPQYQGRTAQFQPNPNLQNGAAPVLPAAQGDQKMAGGGIPNLRRTHGFHAPGNHGLVASKTAGRADRISTGIKPNSFVIPADVVSGVGEGNTSNGAELLHKMFGLKPGTTPYVGASPISSESVGFANGGVAQDVPVLLSGGEYVVHPDSVKRLGNGDLSEGHKILHKFVTMSRQKNIQKLKRLKPPKK